MDDSIGAFLRSRRARLSLEDVGLPARPGRRRVPGLRREDIAQLAFVSVDYYSRLEQGRAGAASDTILESIASALRLDRTEREHLMRLARPTTAPEPEQPTAWRTVPADLRTMTTALREVPTIVLDPAMDVVDCNLLAAEVFGMPLPSQRTVNVLRLTFSENDTLSRIRNGDAVAEAAVAYLRYQSGRFPTDSRLVHLIDELTSSSEQFRSLWSRQEVRGPSSIEIRVEHPRAGALTLHNLWLAAPSHPDFTLVVYSADPGSPSEGILRQLAGSFGAVSAG